MVEFIAPLELETIFVYVLAGSSSIFLFLALLFLVSAGARFRMPGVALIMLVGVFAIFMANSLAGFYVLAMSLGAIALFYLITRFVKN